MADRTPVLPPNDVQPGEWPKGENQGSHCHDCFFAVLFYAVVITIFAVVIVYSDNLTSEEMSDSSYLGYIYAASITGLFSILLSGIMLLVMMRIPTILVKVSLLMVTLLFGVSALVAFLCGQLVAGIIALVLFLLGVCYARFVWHRIPFASANLLTACTAIKSNFGVLFFSFLFIVLTFIWTIVWIIALVDVIDTTETCEPIEGTDSEICGGFSYGYLFLLLVAYFFVMQVLQNTVHVIVAGVVGTWWFVPAEGHGCCSHGVIGSFFRAVTSSFGSICFGSLLVAIIQALRTLAVEARRNGDAGILALIAECILGCLENILEFFNKWAFVYVGLYGYGYIDAGKNVLTLFRARGLDAVITFNLVEDVLFMVSIFVGAMTGLVGLVLEASSDYFADLGDSAATVAFLLGLVIGVIVCYIFLGPISGGVNTVIVLYAEAPAEFQINYPELSNRMRTSYVGLFPDFM